MAEKIDEPCTALEAVNRAINTTSTGTGQYILGQGDYNAGTCITCGHNNQDVPWTGPGRGSDCAGFAIAFCWKIPRHRPGYNRGPWSSVTDWVNVNSLMEDAIHTQELTQAGYFDTSPEPGDLVCYPSFEYADKQFIGHVGIVTYVTSDYKKGLYSLLRIAQCHGPTGFKPGAVITTGDVFQHHNTTWPVEFQEAGKQKVDPCAHIVRMKERYV